MKIHAMAELRPKPDKVDAVKAILLDMVEVTRKEDGNVVYDLFEAENGETLHIIEVWQDEPSLKAHMSTDSFQTSLGKLEDLILEPPRTFRMSPIAADQG